MCKEDSLLVPFVTCNSEVVLKGSWSWPVQSILRKTELCVLFRLEQQILRELYRHMIINFKEPR